MTDPGLAVVQADHQAELVTLQCTDQQLVVMQRYKLFTVRYTQLHTDEIHQSATATSSTVSDQRRKNFFDRKSSFEIEVPPNRRVLRNGDDFG